MPTYSLQVLGHAVQALLTASLTSYFCAKTLYVSIGRKNINPKPKYLLDCNHMTAQRLKPWLGEVVITVPALHFSMMFA